MKKIYATFSGTRYHDTTKRIVEDAPKLGADEVWVFDDVWLAQARPEHVKATEWFRKHPRCRGVDWFNFKSEVAIACIERMADDDLLLFTDADTFPIASLKPFYDVIERDRIMLFRSNGWPHQRVWCKRAAFRIMEQDEPRFWDAPHACARFMGFTKVQLGFMLEWRKFCRIPGCNTFDVDPASGPELEGFREHRCEQAILTNLAHKYGHRLYREACQFGEGTEGDALLDRDLYPQSFFQDYGLSPGDPATGSQFRNV